MHNVTSRRPGDRHRLSAATMGTTPQSRRLWLLHAQLAPNPTAVQVQEPVAVIDPALLEAAAEALAAGELDRREVSPAVVRELMRPEVGFLGYHGAGGLTETERLMADALHVPIEQGGLLQTPMFDATTGRMTAAALAELKKRQGEAASAEDYLAAQYLKHTIFALGPRSAGPLTIDDCVGSAAEPEAAAQLFFVTTHRTPPPQLDLISVHSGGSERLLVMALQKHGFVVIRDCFTPDTASVRIFLWPTGPHHRYRNSFDLRDADRERACLWFTLHYRPW